MFLWGILTNEQPHRHIQPDPTVIHRSFRESSGTNDLGGWFGTLHWNFLQLHLGGVRLVPGGVAGCFFGGQDHTQKWMHDFCQGDVGGVFRAANFFSRTNCRSFTPYLSEHPVQMRRDCGWGYERCWSGDPKRWWILVAASCRWGRARSLPVKFTHAYINTHNQYFNMHAYTRLMCDW